MSHSDLEADTVQPASDPSAPLHLFVDADGFHASAPLPAEGQELSIGRSSQCLVRVEHPSVSRVHATLRVHGGLVQVRDQKSANGTRVRGTPIGEAWVTIVPGDVVELGSAIAVVRRLSAAAQLRRVWSHGFFEGRVEEECARSARVPRPFAVLRVSVGGSAAPGQLEELFAGALRAPDVLAIYAPGELEALLVETTPAQAEGVASRLRALLDAGGLPAKLGIAVYPGDARAADELLAIAHRRVRHGVAEGAGGAAAPGLDESPSMQRLRALIDQVAPGSISVLILGETGVGKEVTAERVHRRSPRAAHTFLRLNCAALSETLLESELFGHEKGAFTGAGAAKPGLIETADGGTVFLDEVGELPPATQVKLLRVLDEKKVLRVGGLAPRAVDVRFVAATNRDLEAEVAAGRFRQDLYYRLAGVVLGIPPLRERVGEIAGLAEHFARASAAELGLATPPAITPAARAVLESYRWPGNVRELRNVVERAVLLSGGRAIEPAHLPTEKMNAVLRRPAAVTRPPGPSEWDEPMVTGPMARLPEDAPAPGALKDELAELEKQRVLDALAACAGNQSAAARMLGISRGTLIARLEAWGISRPRKGR